MYPGVETVDLPNESELDANCVKMMSSLYMGNYICDVKADYGNERHLLESTKSKKKAKKEPGVPDDSPALGFNWNYVYYYRIKSNIQDCISCSVQTNSQMNTHAYREYIDVSDKTANHFITQNLNIANEITKKVYTLRKKTRMYYKEKKPTQFDFWETEFNTYFHNIKETNPTSHYLEKQISDYFDQCVTGYAQTTKEGRLHPDFSKGIEFYVNYLLHQSNLPISDNDMKNAVSKHSNSIDSLTEYSISNMVIVMRTLFYNLYNPINGVLIGDNGNLFNIIIGDVQSFSRILIARFQQQFNQLSEPLLTSFLTTLVVNAMFCCASPMINDILLRSSEKEDSDFAEAVQKVKDIAPQSFGILHELLEEDDTIMKQVTVLDSITTSISPLYRIRSYNSVLANLFAIVNAKLTKKGEKVDSTAVGDCIAKFIILMNPEHFVANYQYVSVYLSCLPENSVEKNGLVYLQRGYQQIKEVFTQF